MILEDGRMWKYNGKYYELVYQTKTKHTDKLQEQLQNLLDAMKNENVKRQTRKRKREPQRLVTQKTRKKRRKTKHFTHKIKPRKLKIDKESLARRNRIWEYLYQDTDDEISLSLSDMEFKKEEDRKLWRRKQKKQKRCHAECLV